MGRADRYAHGDHNAICDKCGQKYKFSQLKKTWDGFWVCPKDWEARNAQDFVRGVPDIQNVPVSRPESTDVFVPEAWTLDPNLQDPTGNLLSLSDAVALLTSYNRSYSDTLSLAESAVITKIYLRSFSDTLTLAESAITLITTSPIRPLGGVVLGGSTLG